MRAVVWEKKGPAREALVLHEDWPRPERAAHQVLIEAAATSVNAGEWKVRSGFAPIPIKLPKILGEDVAGVVVEAPDRSKFKPGDRVFACTEQALKSGDSGGTYGEFVAADEDKVCLMPEGWSYQDAAAVPQAGITAWQALAPAMPLEGKRVLIHGGAGGVGGFAVQIAKAHGAHVTTTCRGDKVAYVTSQLAPDVVIDYIAGDWEAAAAASLGAERYDFVLDTVGGSYQAASLRLLRPRGRIAVVGASGPGVERVSMAGVGAMLAGAAWRTLLGKLRLAPSFHLVMLDGRAANGLEQLADLMRQGKLKVHLDRVFPLEQLPEAHDYLQSGAVCGKVGIRIKDVT